MESSRRVVLAAGVGLAVIALAAASDFVFGSFWSSHAMLTSLAASLIVLAVTVAVLNEWLDRRDRRRWSVLGQYVLFQLVQSARVTWTTLMEVLEGREVGAALTNDELIAAAQRALDGATVSSAARDALASPERRRLLATAFARLTKHSAEVIVSWASVMVGAGPYTELFDRHVELQSRLDWLHELLAEDGRSMRETALARSSVAHEHAVQLGSDERLHAQIVATIQLAVRLDWRSRELAFEIVPGDWWLERTAQAANGPDVSGSSPRSAAGPRA